MEDVMPAFEVFFLPQCLPCQGYCFCFGSPVDDLINLFRANLQGFLSLFGME